MRTPSQIDASRKNGAKSRGPLTPGNKAISSANSLKHGLLAEAIVIDGEAVDQLAALSARFHAEFHPRTESETHHVETMIMCRWRLHRIWEFESAGLNHEINRLGAAVDSQNNRTRAALAFRNLSDQSRSLDLLSRYETRFDRAFIRAHQALMELKSKSVPDWSDDDGDSPPITVTAEAVDDDTPQLDAGSAPEKGEILPNEPKLAQPPCYDQLSGRGAAAKTAREISPIQGSASEGANRRNRRRGSAASVGGRS